MITHLIKLLWNKKRSNFLLTTEIFASFLVLFGVMSMIIFNYSKFGQPLGYDYENVWRLLYSQQQLSDSLFTAAMERSGQQLRSNKEIAEVSRCTGNTPFSQYTIQWDAHHGDRFTGAEFLSADERFGEVLGVALTEGRWINRAEVSTGERVVVLNRQAKEALFGDEPAVGQTIYYNQDPSQVWKVVGVTGNFKTKGEFQALRPVIFMNYKASDLTADAFIIKVKSGADAQFEADLLKELNGIAKGANIELSFLTDQRRQMQNMVKVPMLVASVVCGFLLLNVGLGLFGVLWFNIRKRREEIGLRRALGATRNSVMGQFVSEALIMAGFGTVVGLFFALQFPLFNVFGLDAGIYFRATGASLLILFLLVAICSLYPSREATHVQPAMVLHEE